MEALIDILPGMRMPVAEVIPALAQMWRLDQPLDTENPVAFHASKVNLILHFGLETSGQEALRIFDIACRFAINHPSRIIVLCPVESYRGEEILEGKLFSQCFLGPGKGNVSCCDALILGYPTTESGFLENLVSIWLDSDLPTYLWFHRVPARAINDFYLSFVEDFRCVVFDTSIEHDSYNRINWPALVYPSDLAYGRTLPFRQSMGQFLSRFEPAILADGLRAVVVQHKPGLAGEAAGLLRWQRSCLDACGFQGAGKNSAQDKSFVTDLLEDEEPHQMQVNWIYRDDEKFFSWRYFSQDNTARIEADFGLGGQELRTPLNLLKQEIVLAEALFFKSRNGHGACLHPDFAKKA